MCSLWATAFQTLLLIFWMIISFEKRKSIKYFISIFELQLFSQLSEIVMDSHMLIKTSVWAGYLGACVIVCFSFCLFCLRLREPQLKRKCLHWAGLRGIFSVGVLYEKASPYWPQHLWTSSPRAYKKSNQENQEEQTSMQG